MKTKKMTVIEYTVSMGMGGGGNSYKRLRTLFRQSKIQCNYSSKASMQFCKL